MSDLSAQDVVNLGRKLQGMSSTKATHKETARESAAASIVARLGRINADGEIVEWPGGQLKVFMKLLSYDEEAEAKARAADTVHKRYKDGASNAISIIDAIQYEEVCENLAISIRDGDSSSSPKLFPSASDLRNVASAGELGALHSIYAELCERLDPSVDGFTEEDIDDVVDLIKKKQVTHWKPLVQSMHKSSLLIMVDRLTNSQGETSFVG